MIDGACSAVIFANSPVVSALNVADGIALMNSLLNNSILSTENALMALLERLNASDELSALT